MIEDEKYFGLGSESNGLKVIEEWSERVKQIMIYMARIEYGHLFDAAPWGKSQFTIYLSHIRSNFITGAQYSARMYHQRLHNIARVICYDIVHLQSTHFAKHIPNRANADIRHPSSQLHVVSYILYVFMCILCEFCELCKSCSLQL